MPDSQPIDASWNRAWAIFWVGSVGFILSMFYRVSTTVISVDLTRDLGLSTIQLGDLSAAFFYAFALSQIPMGLALDRLGARVVITLLNFTGVLGAVLFGLAQSAGAAFWGRVLMGIGMSCNLMGMLILFSAWFPPTRFATLSGLFVSIGTLGSLFGATPLALLTRALGWRNSFLAIGAFNAIQAVTFYLVVRNRPFGFEGPVLKIGNPLKGLVKVWALKNYWFISANTFFRYGSLAALQGLWAGPYLMVGLGLNTLEAGNVLLVMGGGYMIGLPIFGRISDRVIRSRKKVIIPSLWILALVILSLSFWPRGTNLFWIYLIFLLLGLAAAPGQIMFPHIKELVPQEITATAMTGVNLFTMLGPAFLTQAIGFVVGARPEDLTGPESFRAGWYLLAGGLSLAACLYLLVPESPVFKKGRAKAQQNR
jgi:MFS family permease